MIMSKNLRCIRILKGNILNGLNVFDFCLNVSHYWLDVSDYRCGLN